MLQSISFKNLYQYLLFLIKIVRRSMEDCRLMKSISFMFPSTY